MYRRVRRYTPTTNQGAKGSKVCKFSRKTGKSERYSEGFAPEEDEVFRYIFCYGFRDNPDPRLDALAKERIYKKSKPAPKTTRTVVVGLKTGEKQTFEIE